jgi:hypothetical protein
MSCVNVLDVKHASWFQKFDLTDPDVLPFGYTLRKDHDLATLL